MPQDLDQVFNDSVNRINELNTNPSEENMKILYGLYKQSTVGDCNTPKPGMLDFKGKAKWNAWNSYKGTNSSDAKLKYINHVKLMLG